MNEREKIGPATLFGSAPNMTDWSDYERQAYQNNVDDLLAIGYSESKAAELAYGMVARGRTPAWKRGSLF